ncbi:MAG: four helix bundle protein [Gemmatimonadales bacterium]
MPNFRSLLAWQYAQRLAVECTRAALRFPGAQHNPLANQLLRVCYSVPLNIAEGSARQGPREFRRFLDVARGSLAEVQSALELAQQLGYVEPNQYDQLHGLADDTARTLWGLLRKVSSQAKHT